MKEYEKKVSIQQLFDTRENLYKQSTQRLLDRVSPVLEAATLVLERTLATEDTTVKWRDILFVDGQLIVIGLMMYSLGDQIVLESGEVVAIDKELQTELQQVIKVGIPLDMAEKGDVAEIMSYILKHSQADFPDEETDQRIPREDFSTAELTEEQQKQLRLYNHINTDKIN